ncbi:MAG: protein kinase [Kofleriaceae bacterium]|nr:protein kinase [Kofleriaceae bacterium]
MTCPHCATQLAVDARFCPACGKATAPTDSGSWPRGAAAAPDLIGKEIAGRYRILAKLGEGGMGAVYRGEQISLKRAVAVKLLRPELGANQVILRRFNAEAEAVAKLSHPNTVNIYDFGQDTDGSLFIAMEFIEGRSLRSAISKDGPFHPARAIAISLQISASLSDAHSHSIVHRDLKPDNVMLQDRGRQKDVVRVLDFGIAKLRDDSRATQQAMTQAGDMLGTPQYMAPEQIRGEAIDGRTDIYALGCLIYEMVTGRMPFEAPTVMAMLSKHLLEQVVPPSQRRPDLALPATIDQLVLGAMAKDPKSRPATMDQFGEMLQALLASLPADPNRSGTAPISAQQSSMQSVATPPAHSAFQPPTPPPPGHAAYGAPGVPAPTPTPFAPHAPPPGYAQPAIPPTMPVGAQPAAKSRTPLYILLAVLALGGIGVGVWAATKGDDKPSKGSAAEPAKPDEDKPAEPEHDEDKADPWADNGTAPDGTDDVATIRGGRPAPADDAWADKSAKKSVGTAETPIPPGATISPPDGFQKVEADPKTIAYADYKRGIIVAMAPLYAGTNDPNKIASMWSKETGAKFAKREKVTLLGAQRDALVFTAEQNGVAVGQLIVLFITDQYRLGVLYQAPANLWTDRAFQPEVDRFFAGHVRLP